jgi:transposase
LLKKALFLVIMPLALKQKRRAMRAVDGMQESLFTVKTLNDFVPADHPLRAIREILNVALARMDERFAAMYCEFGRESIAPESSCARSCCRRSMG